MKRLFILLAAVLMTVSMMAVEKIISPTACGITVGKTTKTGKTLACGGEPNHIRMLDWLGLPGEECEYQKKACIEGFVYAYEGVVYCHYTKQPFDGNIIV